MRYIVIFKRLAGISNVALLVRPMVPPIDAKTDIVDIVDTRNKWGPHNGISVYHLNITYHTDAQIP